MAEEFVVPTTSETYYQLTLTFDTVPASGLASVSIYNSDPARFSIGEFTQTLGGLSISGSQGANLDFNSFSVNSKQVITYEGGNDGNFQLSLFVLTSQRGVGGLVNLPNGTSVTIRSNVSTISVTGSSSWYVPLG